MIFLIDFGSQTAHLIARRVRELGQEVQIVLPDEAIGKIKAQKPAGIIFSGGPASVYAEGAPLVDKEIFTLGIPILGICYGVQLSAYLYGGEVKPGVKKEFGPATFTKTHDTPLFKGLPDEFPVWMNHGDQVIKPPQGSATTGKTETIDVASFADDEHKHYGVQFHVEVEHTPLGREILKNFIEICGLHVGTPILPSIDELVEDIKKQIGDGKAVLALSGGVDSSTAALLVHKAIGDRLTCIYVDTGMMRKGETEQVNEVFKEHFHMNVKTVYAEEEFLKNLAGITDPETKRKTIGKTFIDVFEREALRLAQGKPNEKVEYLVQGTIYPDVIESAGTTHSANIKSHHNVGGLPEKHGFKIVEPLRFYYKDEVRKLANDLGLPESIIKRHVFPGPGLAVRIIGDVTKTKLDILREADAIVTEELRASGWYEKLWMGFAIFTGVKTTGQTGDERRYGELIAIRAVTSIDAMTAEWAHLPYEVLGKMANRIVNEVHQVSRVVYDITTKPPATMEWE